MKKGVRIWLHIYFLTVYLAFKIDTTAASCTQKKTFFRQAFEEWLYPFVVQGHYTKNKDVDCIVLCQIIFPVVYTFFEIT